MGNGKFCKTTAAAMALRAACSRINITDYKQTSESAGIAALYSVVIGARQSHEYEGLETENDQREIKSHFA